MRSYLVVGNQTLAGPELAAVLAERISAGPACFHVVVPATPHQGRFTWEEGEAYTAARERLDSIMARLRELGAQATGEVGNQDPVTAAYDALRGRTVDEVILSTLPPGISRWLGLDVPSRLRGSVSVPVVVVPARAPVNAGSH
jgi:hypothetical protein